jgi:3-phosphoshikimate 1-carboxyvinyltransferase
MLGSLAKGETVVNNFLFGADCLSTIDCFRKLGIQIMTNDECQMSNEGKIIIQGRGLFGLTKPEGILDVGNSGTTIRLMLGILAGQEFVSKITGDSSIQKRPMARVVKPLTQMGAIIEGRESPVASHESYPPLEIIGQKLHGIEYELPIASAQVKSAILFAGLLAKGETTVIEKHPCRDHTERMLKHFGVACRQSSVTGQKQFDGAIVDVPGDISSAAFFMVAAAIMPKAELRMPNVGMNPTRTGIIDILHRMGVNLEISNEQVISEEPRATTIVRHSSFIIRHLKPIRIDGEIVPRIIDEIPIIAVAATQAEGTTEIRGAKELRIKESDRIATLSVELRKMGAKITELDDGMVIEGPAKLKGAKVDSHGDHRIAMALAVAGLVADGETIIEDTACVETSFPGFERLLNEIRS